MGRCSHVAALLKKTWNHVLEYGYEKTACTSLPCQWNLPKKSAKNPQTIQASQYPTKSKYIADKDELFRFNPAPLKRQRCETSAGNDMFRALPDTRSGWSTLLRYTYDEYELTDSRKQYLVNQKDIFLYSLNKQIEDQYDSLCINHDGSSFLVPNSTDQSTSEIWNIRRSIAVTASIAKQAAETTSKSVYSNILGTHLWGLNKPRSSAISYGLENEPNARNEYAEQLRSAYKDVVVEETGLWLLIDQPEIGCSPDGIVSYTDSNDEIHCGLLEIKCPYILRNVKSLDTNVIKQTLSKKQMSRFCCYINDQNKLKLKQSHGYYYQTQLQMHVLKYDWCDFVLWTKRGIHIERISKDETFISTLISKLLYFHHNVLIPEYFEQRVPRKLLPFILS